MGRKWGEGGQHIEWSQKASLKSNVGTETWMKKSNQLWGQGEENSKPRNQQIPRPLGRSDIWRTERRLVWLSEQGIECGRWGWEVGKARSIGLEFYLSAVGSQWKILVSSRLSNLWTDSAGLLTCKKEKPPLFLVPWKGIDSPSLMASECRPQNCNFYAGWPPP